MHDGFEVGGGRRSSIELYTRSYTRLGAVGRASACIDLNDVKIDCLYEFLKFTVSQSELSL